MSIVKISLEYGCYPMWIYNEKGELVGNDLVEELKGEEEIGHSLLDIQDIYDGLFEDNAITFEFKGFRDESDKKVFLEMVESTISLIKAKIGDKYVIENKIEI